MHVLVREYIKKSHMWVIYVEVRPGGDNHPEDQEGKMYLELSGKLWKVLFVFCPFFFLRQVSLCSAGCPGTHYEDQAGLEFIDICLPHHSKC